MEFRYRSTALLGAWKSSAEEATSVALRARQAHRDPSVPGSVIWDGGAHLEQRKV